MMPLRILSAAFPRAPVAAVFLVLLSACGFSRPAPVKQTYLLQATAPTQAAASPRPAVLKVGSISVAAPFRGKSLVYREAT